MGTVVRRVLLVGALWALLLGSVSTAEARSGFLNSLWGPIKFPPGQAGCAGPERCSAFPYYRQLGVEVFQYQLQWDRIAPTQPANPGNPADPAYQWSGELKFAVDRARANGMKVMFMLKGSPGWANGGRSPKWAPRPGAYAAFARAAARKFPGVRHWEIWGESNRAFTFLPKGRKGARRYARILDAAYKALNKVRRRNIVIGGMTLSGGPDVTPVPRWLRSLRGKGGKPPRMDWFGHNPYDFRYPRIKQKPISSFRGLNDVDTLWKEVKALYRKRGRRRGRPRKLWLSEWTIQSDHGSFAFSFSVSRRQQAKRLRAGYRLARKLPYVKGLGWYQLSDYPAGPDNPTWGLITYDGDRKPSFRSYRRLP